MAALQASEFTVYFSMWSPSFVVFLTIAVAAIYNVIKEVFLLVVLIRDEQKRLNEMLN